MFTWTDTSGVTPTMPRLPPVPPRAAVPAVLACRSNARPSAARFELLPCTGPTVVNVKPAVNDEATFCWAVANPLVASPLAWLVSWKVDPSGL